MFDINNLHEYKTEGDHLHQDLQINLTAKELITKDVLITGIKSLVKKIIGLQTFLKVSFPQAFGSLRFQVLQALEVQSNRGKLQNSKYHFSL